ncbi:MAG: TIM barrel protein [Azospirillaceae bacterium]
MIRIGNAAVSWGVDFADTPSNPPWRDVMRGIAEAGYRFTELGPYGYYPTDPDELRRALDENGLALTAGFLFQPLHDPTRHGAIRDLADRTTRLVAAVGGHYLVVIDDISSHREATAGRRSDARPLEAEARAAMSAFIGELADMAATQGLYAVLHQHAGTFLEFEDEVDGVLADHAPDRLGVCADTGHLLYAGIDPAAFIEKHGDRVRHVHFKDLDPARHAEAMAEKEGFLEAMGKFVFCPLGKGAVDFAAVRRALETIGFDGHATVEQDRDPARPADPLDDARVSLAFLEARFA